MKRKLLSAFFLVFISSVLASFVAPMLMPSLQATNRAMVPSYKNFFLSPGDPKVMYYGQNLSHGQMTITMVDLETGENSTPFGAGWINIADVKIDGYTFSGDSDNLLMITSNSWDKGISVWDIHDLGSFDAAGNFIIDKK